MRPSLTNGAAFRLDIPAHLHRNSPTVAVDGYEETGSFLIELATQRLGLDTLADSEVLDIGCGVRFAQTIVNRRIPIKRYTGIEVDSQFDIVWLFSVFTHLDLSNAWALLTLIRKVLRPTGRLLFTAFIDPDLDGFEGRSPGHPLEMVYFGSRTMEGLLRETG